MKAPKGNLPNTPKTSLDEEEGFSEIDETEEQDPKKSEN